MGNRARNSKVNTVLVVIFTETLPHTVLCALSLTHAINKLQYLGKRILEEQ
jgi:hypothetical protein